MTGRLACCLFLCAIYSTAADAAGDYPDHPIKFVVPYTAGGSTDLLARIVAQDLSERYGQSVVVENKPGASGHIGAEAVARSKADGYTLLVGAMPIHSAFAIYEHLNYDPVGDLEPVTVLGEFPNILVVHPSVEASSVEEFLALARSQPAQLFYGTAGYGSATHMAAELFAQVAEVQLTHVPYRGSSAAMADLAGGQIQLMFENLPAAVPLVQDGRVRALGVTSRERSTSLPDTPAIAETVPDYGFTAWYTIAAPKGTPPKIVEKLNADIDAILHSEKLAPRWQEIGVVPKGGSLEQVRGFIGAETEKWSALIEQTGLKMK